LSEPERYKGYDIESKMSDGSPKYIEVKASRSVVPDIELTRNEYQHILNNPEHSFVYVVTNAISNPTLHIIPGADIKDLMARIIYLAAQPVFESQGGVETSNLTGSEVVFDPC